MNDNLLDMKLPDISKDREQEFAYYMCLVGEDTQENRDKLKDKRWIAAYCKNIKDSREMRERLLGDSNYLHKICTSFAEVCEFGRKFPNKLTDWSNSSFLFGGVPIHPRKLQETEQAINRAKKKNKDFEQVNKITDEVLEDAKVGNTYLVWKEMQNSRVRR